MYEYHEQYAKAIGDTDAQARWARQLTWEIARHAVGEEIVVYPLMEKHLGEQGLKLTNHDRDEHQVCPNPPSETNSKFDIRACAQQTVKNLLSHLESLTPGTAEFDETIDKVMKDLHHHNDSEETKDLPLLEPKLGEQGSREAAATFSRTKKFVPTR